MRCFLGGRWIRFNIATLLFVVAYAAVFSALIFDKPITMQPVGIGVLFFTIGMIETLRSYARMRDLTTRGGFLVKETVRNLYQSLLFAVFLWISNVKQEGWLIAGIVIAVLPNWVHWAVNRWMSSGLRRDRLLKVLAYFVLGDTDSSVRPGQGSAIRT